MSREEILKEIERLENEQFCLMMKDLWNIKDQEFDRQITNKIRSLKAQLN